MGWLDLPRVPEPEVMDDSGDVEAYSSAAAQQYLSELDDTFVEHALSLVAPVPSPLDPAKNSSAPGSTLRKALDIGSGPGQILRKLAARLPGWTLVGVDRSSEMIRQARDATRSLHDASHRKGSVSLAEFIVGDAGQLPFPNGSFDLVLCNSVLHHLKSPARVLSEVARVARPSGAILVRDLRRPSRASVAAHIRWYGRNYSGVMYRLFGNSVRAAYTHDELSQMLREHPVSRARIFTMGRTHLGIERAAELEPC